MECLDPTSPIFPVEINDDVSPLDFAFPDKWFLISLVRSILTAFHRLPTQDAMCG